MEITRKCSYCKTSKPHSEFVKNKNDKYGISYGCRACKRIDNFKLLEKIYCEICKIYITKVNLNYHIKSERHELLVQLNKYSSTPIKSK